MKTSFWHRWCDSLRRARPISPISRARPRRQPLSLETLEDRVTPSLTPQLLLDINASTRPAYPTGMVAIGSTTYFAADDGVHGVELWKSDGTANGTVLVANINPGSASSSPANLTNVNGVLFFAADDGVHGRELWTSDGTSAGTSLVKDILPGSDDYPGSSLAHLTAVNGTLFFSAFDAVNGNALWKSDGTATGTTSLRGNIDPADLTDVSGTLFFTARDPIHGRELWKSDGTAAGTTLVKDLQPGGSYSYPGGLTAVDGTLFLKTRFGLWRSDGTDAGTTLVMSCGVGSMTNVDGVLFFVRTDSPHGGELWKSDGTATSTILVKDIGGGTPTAYPRDLTNVNGTLFLVGTGGHSSDDSELWKSDGTAAGTVLVKDIRPGTYGSSPSNLTNVNGALYFTASDGVNGVELWTSDGTTAGTILVKDVNPGSTTSYPAFLTNLNGTLLFAAGDPTHGAELWKSDGTAAGTVVVRDVNRISTSGPGHASCFTDVAGTTFFIAYDGDRRGLWKSDNTTAGTTLVKEFDTGGYGSYPSDLTNLNGTLYFLNGGKLWKSDGTSAGTALVSNGNYSHLTLVDGTLFMAGTDGNGTELWKSDGTSAGTTLVKDIFPGTQSEYYYSYWYGWRSRTFPNSSSPDGFTNVNGTLFFVANDGTNGRELWKSDGTEVGTVLVNDIRIGASGSNPIYLTNVNGTLFFSASNGINGSELWKSDGTALGTRPVRLVNGWFLPVPRELTNLNGTLFFSVNESVHGFELWKSDGTAAGTTLVKDIFPGGYTGYYGYGPYSSSPSNLTDVNGTLFFTAEDGTNGRELWQSDGTAAGTTLVKDIYPGSSRFYNYYGEEYWILNSSSPSNLTNVNGILYLSANDGASGAELWQSDGTVAGTVRVMDINPGNLSSNPANLSNVNGALFFRADDGVHGPEPWVLVGDAIQDTSLSVSGFPATITAGVAGNFTVTAKNADGSTNTSYRGTVYFTSSDSQAALPGNYTFTEADQGVHTFTAALKTVGSQSITVSVANFPSSAGTQGNITVNPAAASHLKVTGFPTSLTAGVAGSFTVTAMDAYGNRATGYTGAVRFTSSDVQAALPVNYTFTVADQGVHYFTAMLKTAGTQSITASDTAIPGGTGTQAGIVVNPGAVNRFAVAGFPSPVTAGVAGSFTVTALDAYGNRATGYTGTVRLTSSDVQAVLPGNYTFTTADAGRRTFSAMFKTAGNQSLTATDLANGAIIGVQGPILVNAAAASRLLVSAPANVNAGVRFSLTVTVVDAYGNVATGYRGTIAFRSSDPTAKLPSNYTFKAADNGVHTFTGVVLKRKGKQTITMNDTFNSSLMSSVLIEVL